MITAAFLGLASGTCFTLSTAGSIRMKRRIAEIPGMIESAKARDGRRPVLRERPVEGPAWLVYDRMLAGVADYRKSYVADPTADWALVDLVNGAQCSDAGGRVPTTPDADWLLRINTVTDIAADRIDAFLEHERHGEALDLLSALLTFAHDVSFNTTLWTHLYGLRAYRAALDRLCAVLRSPTFPRHLYPELARRLELVDASFPLLDITWSNTALTSRIELTSEWAGGTHDGLPGLSPILGVNRLYADAIDVLDDHARRAAALSRRPWNELDIEADAMMAEVRRRWNPILWKASRHVRSVERSLRDVRARLRVLRAYVSWRATRTVPDLADPFGDRILANTDAPRFWSVGADGYDDEGLGTWDDRSADIVFDPR